MENKTIYFEDPKNPQNTDITFKLAADRMKELDINKLVIASTTGTTAKKAMEFYKNTTIKLVVVTHQYGFARKENPFPQELVKELRESGHEVHTATMLFHADKLYGTSIPTVIANFLRCFSEGVKVCFEIVLSATDGGYLKNGEKIAAIAGTGKGADTALIMQASSTQQFKLKVNEILCKPYNELKIEDPDQN